MFRLLAAAALAAVLTACGGGDPEPDEHLPTPGVDCQARPELCK